MIVDGQRLITPRAIATLRRATHIEAQEVMKFVVECLNVRKCPETVTNLLHLLENEFWWATVRGFGGFNL